MGWGRAIDTQSYLNAKKAVHWSKRLNPPTFLKVDQLVAAGLQHPVCRQHQIQVLLQIYDCFGKHKNIEIKIATVGMYSKLF